MEHSPRYRRLRALLRATRSDAGLTQVQLAVRLKKPQTFVSKSELGERRLDLWELIDFCAACEIDPREFIQNLMAAKDNPSRPTKRNSPPRMDAEGNVSKR